MTLRFRTVFELILDASRGLGYDNGMKEILRTNDPTILAFAEALLRGEDIDCFILDVHMSVLEGGIGLFPRRMVVSPRDAFRARSILRDNDIEVAEAK